MNQGVEGDRQTGKVVGTKEACTESCKPLLYVTRRNRVLSTNQSGLKVEATLDFKRAIWLVGGAILASQVFGLALVVSHGYGQQGFPGSYHLISEIGTAIWYLILSIVVVAEIKRQAVSPSSVFNFHLSVLGVQSKRIVGYFLGCAGVVVGTTALIEGEELGLGGQTEMVHGLAFLVAVVVGPVVEEMAFRGYLYSAMIPTFKREKERMVVNGMLFAGAHVFLESFLLGASVPYYIFVLGFLLARLYDKSRSILPCITLHVLNNALVFFIEFMKLNGQSS